jgi:CHAT domain-containing protein
VLTTGAGNVILRGRSFLGPYQQGNIELITQNPPLKPEPSEPKPKSPVCPLNDCARPPIPTPFAEPPKLAPEKVFDELEENFTKEYESYLGVQGTRVKSLKETQKELAEAREKTGLNVGLVYVFFSNKKHAQLSPSTKEEASSVLPFVKVSGELEDPNDEASLKSNYLLHTLLVTADKVTILPIQDKKVPKDFIVNNDRTCPEGTDDSFGPVIFSEVKPLVSKFRSQIATSIWEKTFLPVSNCLYKKIVEPLESKQMLKGLNHIAFIMDRGLRSLPVAALYKGKDASGNYSYLAQDYSISLTPSYSLLRTDYRDISQEKMWIMGASKFTDEEDLVLADIQMNLLHKIWGEDKSEVFRNEEFNSNRLKPCKGNVEVNSITGKSICRPDISIVHLITHANFAFTPKDSHIVFSDGLLDFNAVQRLKLDSPPPPPIELFVLTACQTAMSSEEMELGFAGAAVKTRVKTVMASLWKVEETGAFILNIEFYGYLKESKTKAAALQRAQIAMINSQDVRNVNRSRFEVSGKPGNYQFQSSNGEFVKFSPNTVVEVNPFHPKNWAGFILVGTPW